MPKWGPCKRRDFIRKLKRLGFGDPEPGGRHFYMRYGEYTLPIPGNQEYSVDQLKVLLLELKEALGRKIVLDEWVGL